MNDKDQELVAAILKSAPPPDVPADFLARVNARIDETAGWLGLADFRAWTLRLAPAAVALALIALLWPASQTQQPSSSKGTPTVATQPSTFSPSSSTDWQREVTADALIDAALRPAGAANVR